MGNACNCVSRADGNKEIDLKQTKNDKKKASKAGKQEDLDESNLQDDDALERPNEDDPELVNAAIKIQVTIHLL
jgi:hypothetical protein